jgi:hypothetical protein
MATVTWLSKLRHHYIVQSTCQATHAHVCIQGASCIVTPHTVVLHRKPLSVEPSANSFCSQNSNKRSTLDYSTTVCLSVCLQYKKCTALKSGRLAFSTRVFHLIPHHDKKIMQLGANFQTEGQFHRFNSSVS